VQNSRYVQVLRSPILATLLHGTPAAGVRQTLRRGTRNGITEISQRARPIFGWAAITLGIGPHSSCHYCAKDNRINQRCTSVATENCCGKQLWERKRKRRYRERDAKMSREWPQLEIDRVEGNDRSWSKIDRLDRLNQLRRLDSQTLYMPF